MVETQVSESDDLHVNVTLKINKEISNIWKGVWNLINLLQDILIFQ